MDTWSRELREYAARAEAPAFRKQAAALLAEDAYWGLERVRTPTKLAFGTSRERIVTFLMGCEVLGSDPDSGAYVVAAWGGANRATSMVASFLFNDVAPQDEQPGDFVVEALSIRDWLARKPRPGRSSTVRDRETRYRRALGWAQVFQGNDWDGVSDDLDEIRRTLRAAAKPAAYARERRSIATRPDVAAYWLMAHAARDDRAGLADVIARTEGTKYVAIAKLRGQLAAGASVIANEWKKRGRGSFAPLG